MQTVLIVLFDGVQSLDVTGPLEVFSTANRWRIERDGAPGLVKKVTDLFLEDTPRQLADLLDSAQRGDCARLAKLAHTLKGSAANLGAREMVRVCGELEALGQDGDVSIVPSLVADLESQFNSVRDALLCEDATG